MSECGGVGVDTLVFELQHLNGASVHTVNKAISYLRSLSKPVWYLRDDTERVAMFESLKRNCRIAINTGNVEPLGILMRRWF